MIVVLRRGATRRGSGFGGTTSTGSAEGSRGVTAGLEISRRMASQQMNDPARDTWQKPQEVLTKLAIKPGSRVADLGAGDGYFT